MLCRRVVPCCVPRAHLNASPLHPLHPLHTQQYMESLIRAFPVIEVSIRTSSRQLRSVSDVFFQAIKTGGASVASVCVCWVCGTVGGVAGTRNGQAGPAQSQQRERRVPPGHQDRWVPWGVGGSWCLAGTFFCCRSAERSPDTNSPLPPPHPPVACVCWVCAVWLRLWTGSAGAAHTVSLSSAWCVMPHQTHRAELSDPTVCGCRASERPV